MKSRSTIVAALSIALLCAMTLTGCSDPKAKAAGTYEVDKAAIKAAAEAEVKAKGESNPDAMAAGMMASMIDQMTMTMTLNADGTASMVTTMMGQTNAVSGTWALSGDSIAITAAKAGEKPETINGTISGDTITLKPPPEENVPFDLVFHKKKG